MALVLVPVETPSEITNIHSRIIVTQNTRNTVQSAEALEASINLSEKAAANKILT